VLVETRRLAAIMFTDIVGFSRQMGADEARMLRLLKVHNQILQRTVSLAPNEAEGSGMLGLILNFAGQPGEAIELIEKAIRLNPRYANYSARLGMAYGLTRQYDEAIIILKAAVIRTPDHLPLHLHLVVSYSELGRDEEARTELAEMLRLSPKLSLEGVRRVMPFKDPASLERYLTALRKAGLK
jgi:tetratricopeptide (TPR) repeat protein